MTTVYCITGYPGSGKSVAADVASELSYPVIGLGSIVRENAHNTLGEDATGKEISEWATAHREQCGNEIFARYAVDSIKDGEADVVVIEGVRTPKELAVLRDAFDTVVAVLVDASFNTRYERITSRGREDEGTYTEEDFRARDAREEAWGLKEILKNKEYDVAVRNEGTLPVFKDEIASVLQSHAAS